MKKCVRKRYMLFLLSLCLTFFAGCGQEEPLESAPAETGELPAFPGVDGERLDVAVDSNDFYRVADDLPTGRFLCMQFYQGEAVQLWMSEIKTDDGGNYVEIYAYRRDGSREICLERVSRETGMRICFMDGQGHCYAFNRTEREIAKLDKTGENLYTVRLDDIPLEMRQLQDGRIVILTMSSGSAVQVFTISLMDEAGNLAAIPMEKQITADSSIGVWGEGLLLREGNYIYELGWQGERKLLFSFQQNAYELTDANQQLRDFTILEDGNIALLRADLKGNGSLEMLSLLSLEGREQIVLRSLSLSEDYSGLKDQVLKFNSLGNKYYVVIETLEAGDDRDAFITATGVELATGRGADILMGTELITSAESLIAKGGFLDLAPMMAQSGMREEDYFPLTFAVWRTGESIYSATYQIGSISDGDGTILTEALGGAEEPGIQELLDALMTYPQDAALGNARRNLEWLLGASETLFGMVDWEKGTCDFGGELFARMLDVSKRYSRSQVPVIRGLGRNTLEGFYHFQTREEIEAEGYTALGALFDDGWHPTIGTDRYVMAINANSGNPEGAWEFIRFLLSEEIQGQLYQYGGVLGEMGNLPVLRSAFQAAAERAIQVGPPRLNQSIFTIEGDLTQDRVDEMVSFIENARRKPFRTEVILDIILEESQPYFDGTKDISQVVKVIENRVRLYLQERVR